MNTIVSMLMISIISPLAGLILLLSFKKKFIKFFSFFIPPVIFAYLYYSLTYVQCEVDCVFINFILLASAVMIVINFIILGIGIFLSIKIKKI